MIAVEDQTTAGTNEYSHIQRHRLPMSTSAACLTRIGRVHCNVLPTSFFRFAGQLVEELRPRGIMNALGETMIMGHAIDTQVLYRNEPKVIDKATAFLVREVVAAERDTLMYSCNRFPVLAALRRAFREFAMLALDFGKSLFFLAEKARVGNRFPSRQGGKGFQTYIDTDLFGTFGQTLRLTLDREASMLFAGRGTLDCTGFHLALNRAVIDHLDTTYLGEADPLIVGNAEARLREGERVVALMPFETRVAWVFTILDAAEEGLKSQFYSFRDILQDLGIHAFQRRAFSFEKRDTGFRLIPGSMTLLLFPSIFTIGQRLIVEPAAFFKRGFKRMQLFLGRV